MNIDFQNSDLFVLPQEYLALYQDAQKGENKEIFIAKHKNILKNRKEYLESFLDTLLLDTEIPSRISEAMRYSLMAGGKRIRPILCLSCFYLCGAKSGKNITQALPFAAALEMIHTYSLIHDDLPAMDDDDMRRGAPTCHKKFDEGTAILAGDGLLTDAFYMMTLSEIPAPQTLKALQAIALAVGSQGMVGGQMLDLEAEARLISLEELCVLNAKKTGALLRTACESGAILAGASKETQEAIAKYGEYLGIAFQIIDDVLDIIGDSKALGKNTGSDEKKQKSTWPSLIGLEESKKEALEYCKKAVAILDTIEDIDILEKSFLQQLAYDMAVRTI